MHIPLLLSISPHFACICLFHFLFNALAFVFHSPWRLNLLFCLLLAFPPLSKFCIPSSIMVQWPAILLFFLSFDATRLKFHKVSLNHDSSSPLLSFLFIVSSFKRSLSAAFWLSLLSRRREVQSCSSPYTLLMILDSKTIFPQSCPDTTPLRLIFAV